jgi:very-short-patch-repair endonuclease
MKPLPTPSSCCNCLKAIDEKVKEHSLEHFEFPLCIPCQKTLRDKIESTTPQTLALYFSLREKKIPAELEKFDGFKTIDIAVVEARVNIEVDGAQHNTKHDQALADLKRTYWAFKKGYYTLRIPNSLVKNHLEETAKYVADFIEVSKSKNRV